MISLTVTARLCSPVHLGAKNTGAYFVNSLDFIPGRAFLGAAAWAWIDEGGDPESPDFAQRFVSGDVSWGDLLPVPQENGAAIDGMPLTVPRTTKTCKLFGLEHGCVDDLLLTSQRNDECGHGVRGGACGAGLKRLEDVVVIPSEGPLLSPELSRQHRTHLSIGFDTGTSRHGYLYSLEVLQEGQFFRGRILCASEKTADALINDLQRLSLAVGKGRSRGYGELEVMVEREKLPAPTVDEVLRCSERIAAGQENAADDARFFTLTAGSAWFLRESDGAHARSFTSSRLAQTFCVDEKSVKILTGDARSEARSGWDGAAGLPTEVRQVILAGSTFLCRIACLDDEELHKRLTALQEHGIGSNRLEGLGRVIVNHQLHFSEEANRAH